MQHMKQPLGSLSHLRMYPIFPLKPYRSKTYHISLFHDHSGKSDGIETIKNVMFLYSTIQVKNRLKKT